MTPDEIDEVQECPRRGRPRIRRTIIGNQESRCFRPCCCPEESGLGILLHPEEIELIRLSISKGLSRKRRQHDSGSRARLHGAICMKPGARSLTPWSTGKGSRCPAAQKRLKAGARSVPNDTSHGYGLWVSRDYGPGGHIARRKNYHLVRKLAP